MASKLERARQSTSRLRQRVQSAEPLRAFSSFGAGLAIGTLESKDIVPPTIGGFPVKPAGAALAMFIASNSSVGSGTHSVFAGIGEGLLGAYGYAAGKAGSLIAGQYYDETE